MINIYTCMYITDIYVVSSFSFHQLYFLLDVQQNILQINVMKNRCDDYISLQVGEDDLVPMIE